MRFHPRDQKKRFQLNREGSSGQAEAALPTITGDVCIRPAELSEPSPKFLSP